MTQDNYVSFMEKITRKLADTFSDLNRLCLDQLALIAKNPQNNSMIVAGEKGLVSDNLIGIEEVQDEVVRQIKTKKIKKEGVLQQEARQGEEGRSKKRAKKLSHKPKAPASSFLLFFKEQQPNIARGYPTYGVTELTKVAAKCWSELSNQQKQPYIKLCDQQRRVYQEKMQRYRVEFPEEIAEKEKDRKQLKKDKKSILKDNPRKEGLLGTDLTVNAEPEKINGTELLREDLEDYFSLSDKNEVEEQDSLGML